VPTGTDPKATDAALSEPGAAATEAERATLRDEFEALLEIRMAPGSAPAVVGATNVTVKLAL
jgi:hypothetical protein